MRPIAGVTGLHAGQEYRGPQHQVPPEAVQEARAQPGILFEMGELLVIESYRQGRSATRAESAAAIARGLPQQLLRLWPS